MRLSIAGLSFGEGVRYEVNVPACIFRRMKVEGTPETGQTLKDELVERFDAHLRASDLLLPGSAITVALSGGLDSVVLLDLLLRLRDRRRWDISAAHFDHRMRKESASEAAWVGGLCSRRGVPYRLGRAPAVPKNEAEARELRYEFLQRARAAHGARWLVTAHQADDQAETVLFRLLRGSGLAGLAGIPTRRGPDVVRPLLPFWRSELEAYVQARGLLYLADPSNLDLRIARNRIRHRLIPEIEALRAPQYRRDLFRLSELAGRATAVVGELTEKAIDKLIIEATEPRIVVARKELLAYDTEARAHLLRALVARVGPRPGRIGTRIALKFVDSSSSGRAVDLAGNVVLRREFERFVIERPADPTRARDRDLVIGDSESGASMATIGGVPWEVCWQLGEVGAERAADVRIARFDPAELEFPLTLRGRRPGDRVRHRPGTRTLKRLFVDRKIGRGERARYPVLVDQSGVLWVVDLVRSTRAVPREGREVFSVRVRCVG